MTTQLLYILKSFLLKIGFVVLLLLSGSQLFAQCAGDTCTPYHGGNGNVPLYIVSRATYIDCTPAALNMALGGTADGHASREVLLLHCDTNALYKGGFASGSYTDARNDINCTPSTLNIALGGIADGHSSNGVNELLCDTNAIYKGGMASGASVDKRDDIDCTLPSLNIALGGVADGHSSNGVNELICDTNMLYRGGIASGISVGTQDAIDCTPASINIAVGGSLDGHSTDTSGCTSFVPICGVTANAGVDDTICMGDNTTLTASGGLYYLWSTGATTASINIGPTYDSTFTVIVSDLVCADTDTVVVVVHPLPVVSITATPNDTICNGDTTVLKASGGTAYSWNTGAVIDSIIVHPTVTTPYTVTVTNVFSCVTVAKDTVVVHPVPIASIMVFPNDTICNGTTDTLIAMGAGAGGSYLWNDTSTNDTNIVSPSSTTAYTVTVTNAYMCSDTESVNIVVNAMPTASFVYISADTICAGAADTLIATGAGAGGSYLWSDASVNDTNIVNPSSTTTYTVTAITALGCSDDTSAKINVIPGAAITGTTTICYGQSTTLTASGGVPTQSYLWSTSATTSSILVSPSSTTNYSVTVTDSHCTTSASKTVTVNTAVASISVAPNDTICKGSSTVLTSDPGVSYLWNTGQTTQAISVSPTSSNTYIVTMTNASSCTAVATQMITVIPDASITGTTTICPGTNTTLTATGGMSGNQTYLWSTTETTQSITVAPGATTSYTVTITDPYCSASANVTVTVLGACSSLNVAVGGISDGNSMGAVNNLYCDSTSPYLGGVNDGFSIDLKSYIDCTPASLNIALGGIADGHTAGIVSNLYCNTNAPYLGGLDDGASIDLKNYIDCTPAALNIALGGIADGHSSRPVTYLYCNTNVAYLGGLDDGSSIDLKSYIDCTPAPLNIGTGGPADGYSMNEPVACIPAGGPPLPITLLDFTATVVENKEVLLEWTTVSEINNDYFTVEKTKDGRNYSAVGILAGAGNSTELLNYSLIDDNPYKGTSYYRLKQTDYDGKFKYSQLESVTILAGGIIINAYPNPVTEELTIQTFTEEEFAATIEIYDVLGKRVFYKEQLFEKNSTTGNKLFINTSDFREGMYIMSIRNADTNNTLHIQRLVKLGH